MQQLIADTFNRSNRDLTLWNIQPGLGTVMIKYGRRFAMAQLAAKTQYQIEEATEIQEVGVVTRPANAELLKNFEQNFLEPIIADIEAKDGASFDQHVTGAIDGCNDCHVATGHPYVVVQEPPGTLADFLDLPAGA